MSSLFQTYLKVWRMEESYLQPLLKERKHGIIEPEFGFADTDEKEITHRL